jgi:uncharacterized protein with PIN domain
VSVCEACGSVIAAGFGRIFDGCVEPGHSARDRPCVCCVQGSKIWFGSRFEDLTIANTSKRKVPHGKRKKAIEITTTTK